MTRIDTVHRLPTLILLLVVVGTCVADPTPQAAPLSLDKAIQLALAHDPAVQLAKLELKAAQIEYDRERSAEVVGGTKASEVKTEADLKSARLANTRDMNDAIIAIIDEAYVLEAAELSARTKEDQVSSTQQTVDLIVGKEATGAASKLDELSARADLNTAQAGLLSAQLSKRQAEQSLRQRLGLPENKPVAIGDLPTFQTYRPPDGALASARSADPDIVQKQAAVSLAQIELGKVRAGAAAPLDLRKAENGVAVAEMQLAKAEDDLDSSLLNDIAAVQQTADDYHSATMSLQLARQRHDIILQQHETGQKTDLDVLNDSIALQQSEATQLDALRSYVKALLTLKVMIGTDLRPASEVAIE